MLRVRMEAPALQPWSRASARGLRRLGAVVARGGFELGRGDVPADWHVAQIRGTGTYLPSDGVVHVEALLARYLRRQQLHTGTCVHGVQPDDAGVEVLTNQGTIRAQVFVNATGAFAGALGALPIVPTKRHLFLSAPDPQIDPEGPYVWDFAAGYYFRPEERGWLLCACDETPCDPEDLQVDPQVQDTLHAKLRAHQPRLANVKVVRTWCGHRSFAPDRLPVLGWDPRHRRVFHVAGLGGHGVTLSFEVGRRAALAILDKRPMDPAFSPERVLQATNR